MKGTGSSLFKTKFCNFKETAYMSKKDIESNLTEEQLNELDEAIAEADKGDTITYEEFRNNMEAWRTKLKSAVDSK
jgi:predicted transcriptional regulator